MHAKRMVDELLVANAVLRDRYLAFKKSLAILKTDRATDPPRLA